ncbi:MAG: peptidoglycan binding domain-containing protein, partial [Parcubacteria group bacterium]
MLNIMKIVVFSSLLLVSSSLCYGKEPIEHPSLLRIEPTRITNTINMKVRNDSYSLTPEEMAGWITEKNDLHFNPRHTSEIETLDICGQKKSILCNLLTTTQDQSHIQKSSAFFLNTELVKKYIETLAQKINREPVNATLNMQDGKISVFTLNQKGIQLDNASSTALLISYLIGETPASDIQLAYSEKDPDISIDSIDNLGITSLIGEGHSNFRG